MNIAKGKSPKITSLAWGEMVIEGLGRGKDYKLWPGGGRLWDWRETKTDHVSGIQPADVVELLERGCNTIILSQGMQQRLFASPETLKLLQSKNITVHVAETKQAAQLYNDLAERGIAVGGLFHSTC